MSISALVLTYNEESNLPRCLESLHWCDDVVVLDSNSIDGTMKIAESFGARLFQRPFDNYASQRNYGLNQIEYKHRWMLMVDADEEITEDLAQEIKTVLESVKPDISLYRIRRKDFFLGRWIKHASGYPTWFGRLIKIGHVKVVRAINEEYISDGEIGCLKNHIYHYPFNKGFASWFEKHNRYSTMEAELIVKGELYLPRFSDLLGKDSVMRRRTLKAFVYRMPGRPLLMFLALYFVRGGFLDGRAGLTFCLLRSFYEFMINCKVKEIRRGQRGLPV